LENTLGSDQRANGRPFHTKGPTAEKARLCMVEVRANGTWRRPCSAEQRWQVLRAKRLGKGYKAWDWAVLSSSQKPFGGLIYIIKCSSM